MSALTRSAMSAVFSAGAVNSLLLVVTPVFLALPRVCTVSRSLTCPWTTSTTTTFCWTGKCTQVSPSALLDSTVLHAY